MKLQVQHTVLGIHYWEGCDNPEVHFLKNPHHHDFTFYVETEVTNEDREIEFLSLRIELMKLIDRRYPGKYIKNFNNRSCETISKEIGGLLSVIYYGRDFKVSVSEDKISKAGEW